jgi:phosphate transport system protein
MTITEHTSKQFDTELEWVRARVLNMGGLVENNIWQAIEVLTSHDARLMHDATMENNRIGALAIEIDGICNQIVARRQPAAVDLRTVMTVIKIINDLNRIGDETRKLTRISKLLSEKNSLCLPHYNEIKHAAKLALNLLHESLDAYARMDTSAAARIVREDEQLDEEFRNILRYLITFMMEDPRTISTSLEILFVAKAIERIGDHAKNISKYVVYMVNGRDVRHVSVEEIEHETLG